MTGCHTAHALFYPTWFTLAFLGPFFGYVDDDPSSDPTRCTPFHSGRKND
jgi:hypothetical protein